MSGMTPEVYRQNMIVIFALQAISGVLTTKVKSVTVEFVESGVVAHFLLREESREDREEIEENFPTELSVFANGVPGVGDIRVTPIIELVAEHPPGYVPPGVRILHFRE
jgi:hypothetical protein